MTRASRPSWQKSSIQWERKVLIWERLALGDNDSQAQQRLQLSGDNVDRNTIALLREELPALPEGIAGKLPAPVQAYRRDLLVQTPGGSPAARRRPQTPLQQEAFDRCQLRTAEQPLGDHRWMEEARFENQAYTLNKLPPREVTAGPEEGKLPDYAPLGWRICATQKTCWFCGYETEVAETRWAIDPLAGVFGHVAPC